MALFPFPIQKYAKGVKTVVLDQKTPVFVAKNSLMALETPPPPP